MSEPVTKPLEFDKVASGDSASLVVLGIWAAACLRKHKKVAFGVDVMGRVCMLDPDLVSVPQPRVAEGELDKLPEDEAIRVLLAQGDDENKIIEYLEARHGRQSL